MAFLFCANGPAPANSGKIKILFQPKSEQDQCGGDDRDRTDYLLNAIQALSQVSYTPTGNTRIKCSFILSDFSRIVKNFFTITSGRKSQAFIAYKFSISFLFNFDMTIWPPSIPLVGSLRFSLLCSSFPLHFPPFSHASHPAYADSPISRKQARKATSLLIYPSIFRG